MSPVRRCLGCKTSDAKENLVRIVAVERRLVVDEAARRAGRGAYVHRREQCVERSIRTRAWGRALRVSDPLDVEALARIGATASHTEMADGLMDLS